MKFLQIFFLVSITVAVNAGVIFRCDFTPDEMTRWKLPPEATVVKDGDGYALKVTVDSDKKEQTNCAVLRLDLSKYRGRQLWVTGEMKAENVTKPFPLWNGTKFMIHYTSEGQDVWKQAKGYWGTFDWREVAFLFPLNHNATNEDLMLGLQASTGTVYFRNIEIKLFDPATMFPEFPVAKGFKAKYSGQLASDQIYRGMMSPVDFKPGEIAELAQWNVNLIRMQFVRNWGVVGSDRDKEEYLSWLNGRIVATKKVLDEAAKHNIKVIVDLHTPPGGRYEWRDMAMFHEPEYADLFVTAWEQIVRALQGHPALLAYDLINEPMQTRPGTIDYLALQYRAALAIREIDPETPICIESNEASLASSFGYLKPLPLNNIIYQFHFYTPGDYTHQALGIDFTKNPNYLLKGYPGTFEGLPFDAKQLRKLLVPVREFQEKYGVRIYCGEFSAVRWAPGADRYLEDLIEIFEEYGWDWSYHSFREYNGWSVEHSDNPLDNERSREDTPRKKVLLKYFQKNL